MAAKIIEGKIAVSDLRLHAYHGFYDSEREHGQMFALDPPLGGHVGCRAIGSLNARDSMNQSNGS